MRSEKIKGGPTKEYPVEHTCRDESMADKKSVTSN